MDEDELLDDVESMEDRMTTLFRVLLTDTEVPILCETEVTDFEKAMKKVNEKLEKSKKMMLTSDDILGVANMCLSTPKRPEINMDLEELDYGPETPEPEEEEDDDVVVVVSSESEEEPEKENIVIKKPTNVSTRDFVSYITDETPYLRMTKTRSPVDMRAMNLFYPIGVAFDDISASWFVSDKRNVIRIPTGDVKNAWNVIKHGNLSSPTALTIYKKGSKLAVLCSDGPNRPRICIVDIISESVTDYCSWRDRDLDFFSPVRGLARSKGGNLLTIDYPYGQKPRLRVFTETRREKTFELSETQKPSFIASSGNNVVITDLGFTMGSRQTVLHILLDDTDWRHVDFQVIRILGTGGLNLSAHEMLNRHHFVYVAGVQIDKFGNVIIADAKNHHFKLFDASLGFVHRISTDFPVPYVSHFHINEKGEVLILSTREGEKLHFARLTASNRLEKHIPAVTFPPRVIYKSHVSKPRTYSQRDRSPDLDRSSGGSKSPKVPKMH